MHIAITDSGFKWDTDDLIDKVWLNDKELASHKPLHADATPCGGTGALAGFDCNGDGILSVSDYADTPSLAPDASMGHPLGDKNGNGKLDAGDIILNFSDGIDDDGNGYVDDISGWDFMKDDNDPYDDTRYGHGTGEAHDSSSAANNMMGDAGVVPDVPLRRDPRAATASSPTSSNFAKAVVYATDNGAKIMQCALGTINNNEFTQSALDYAYEKGVLSDQLSMADENSRHHNMPGDEQPHAAGARHRVRRRRRHETRPPSSPIHPCSNYGGQNFLSGVGDELLQRGDRAALRDRRPALLGGAQVRPVARAHAGRGAVDLLRHRRRHQRAGVAAAGLELRWSQHGFDQRFGYGRVNANHALEAIRDKKIPPAVDITSPTWFSVLYKDQVDGADRHRGHRLGQARRASYDYKVEWAPGVQPLDERVQDHLRVAVEPRPEHGRRQGRDAPRHARHPHHRPDAHAGRRQPARRERRRDHRARARRRPLRRRASATCPARCGAPITCTRIPDS